MIFAASVTFLKGKQQLKLLIHVKKSQVFAWIILRIYQTTGILVLLHFHLEHFSELNINT